MKLKNSFLFFFKKWITMLCFLFCFTTGALMHGFIDEKKNIKLFSSIGWHFFLLLCHAYTNDPFNRHHQQIEFNLQIRFDQDMSFYATFALICSIKVDKSLNRKKFCCFFFTFINKFQQPLLNEQCSYKCFYLCIVFNLKRKSIPIKINWHSKQSMRK